MTAMLERHWVRSSQYDILREARNGASMLRSSVRSDKSKTISSSGPNGHIFGMRLSEFHLEGQGT